MDGCGEWSFKKFAYQYLWILCIYHDTYLEWGVKLPDGQQNCCLAQAKFLKFEATEIRFEPTTS